MSCLKIRIILFSHLACGLIFDESVGDVVHQPVSRPQVVTQRMTEVVITSNLTQQIDDSYRMEA